jgi:hypothetical protein
VSGRQQQIGPATILQAEQVVAVVGPAPGGLVGLARQQRGEVHFLEAFAIHLLAHHALDVAVDDPAQRQPGEPAGRRAADVATTHQQAVAGHFCIDGVLAQGTEEQRRHSQHWTPRLLGPLEGGHTSGATGGGRSCHGAP